MKEVTEQQAREAANRLFAIATDDNRTAEELARDVYGMSAKDAYPAGHRYVEDVLSWAHSTLARIESERAAQAEFNARVERALNMLRGPRESYRPILTDRDKILARICSYAKRVAQGDDKQRSVPVWSVISDITGHGAGVSSAIYELYRERDDDETKGGAS